MNKKHITVFDIPLGMCRSVERINAPQKRHPVRDASLTGGVSKILGFLNIFSFRNCPVRDMIWVEKYAQRERIVPLRTGYSTDILSVAGQRFPVGDTFSTHIFSIAGKRERTFFTIIYSFFTSHSSCGVLKIWGFEKNYFVPKLSRQGRYMGRKMYATRMRRPVRDGICYRYFVPDRTTVSGR